MKNMRWPGKSSKKQQAGSQLWLETLTGKTKRNKKSQKSPRLRSEFLLHLGAMMSTQVHYRQNQVPTGENGSDAKHLFQWQSHEEPKASQSFLEKSCWAAGLLCSHRFGVQLIKEDVPPNCSDFSDVFSMGAAHADSMGLRGTFHSIVCISACSYSACLPAALLATLNLCSLMLQLCLTCRRCLTWTDALLPLSSSAGNRPFFQGEEHEQQHGLKKLTNDYTFFQIATKCLYQHKGCPDE